MNTANSSAAFFEWVPFLLWVTIKTPIYVLKKCQIPFFASNEIFPNSSLHMKPITQPGLVRKTQILLNDPKTKRTSRKIPKF